MVIDDGFLGPKFSLQCWPVGKQNIPIHDILVEHGGWETNPLSAYCEGSDEVSLCLNTPHYCQAPQPKFPLPSSVIHGGQIG